MQHRASDDPELQLLSKDDDSQGKSKAYSPASSDDWDPAEPAVERQWRGPVPWYRRRYNRGTAAAFCCFVLVMASFLIPESAPPITAMASAVWQFGQSAHQLTKHQYYHLHLHLHGHDHRCMALPEPLLGTQSIQRAAIAGVPSSAPQVHATLAYINVRALQSSSNKRLCEPQLRMPHLYWRHDIKEVNGWWRRPKWTSSLSRPPFSLIPRRLSF